MALSTFVRVSGVNNLSDARYCAGMEVNEIGFNIEPNHSNHIDPATFTELAEWLSGVEFVGEITDKSTDIAEAIKGYQLNAIQVEDLGQITPALATGLNVSFIAQSVDEAHQAWELSEHKLNHLLLSTANIEGINPELPLLINDGFDVENLNTFLESTSAQGIVLEGGNEIRPGYKDFDELADILELLEIDDLA